MNVRLFFGCGFAAGFVLSGTVALAFDAAVVSATVSAIGAGVAAVTVADHARR